MYSDEGQLMHYVYVTGQDTLLVWQLGLTSSPKSQLQVLLNYWLLQGLCVLKFCLESNSLLSNEIPTLQSSYFVQQMNDYRLNWTLISAPWKREYVWWNKFPKDSIYL